MSSTNLSLASPAIAPAWLQDSVARRYRAEQYLPLIFGIGTCLLDVALVMGAFLLAYWVRFVIADDSVSALGLEQYLIVGGIVGALTAVSFATHNFYDEDRPQPWPARTRVVLSSVSTALVVAATVSFFLGDQRFSRVWLGTGTVMSIASLLIWRSFAHGLYIAARDQLAPSNHVIIVGANSRGIELARELASTHQVVGFVDNGTDVGGLEKAPLLGPIAELEHLAHAHGATEVVIALPPDRQEQVRRVVSRGFRRPMTIRVAPELDELPHGRLAIEHVGGRTYIGFSPMAKVSWLKRTMDVVLGTAILIGITPLLAIIALAIKIDSRGPLLYLQERVGKDGRHFRMYKFRSMSMDADKLLDELRAQNEASGPLFKIRSDPRVTRVGKVLRRFSLDELPQLLNVLRGEMSLVGPRPSVPNEVAQYEDWHLGRLRAVPGMTGLWQANGRSEVPFHDMVRLDLHYIQNWSLALDLEILVRTVPAVVSHRGAY